LDRFAAERFEPVERFFEAVERLPVERPLAFFRTGPVSKPPLSSGIAATLSHNAAELGVPNARHVCAIARLFPARFQLVATTTR
jgi:hypothetical protein